MCLGRPWLSVGRRRGPDLDLFPRISSQRLLGFGLAYLADVVRSHTFHPTTPVLTGLCRIWGSPRDRTLGMDGRLITLAVLQIRSIPPLSPLALLLCTDSFALAGPQGLC